jgi:DNA-directed RNA polymerase specialized sigma24 family protein
MNHPADRSDEELANSLSDSDDQAFAALVDRHARSLHDFAIRLTLDSDAAEEITRSSFEYLRTDSQLRPENLSVRAWLLNFAMEQGLAAANDRDRTAAGRLSTGDRRFTQADAEVNREAALWAWQAARSLRPRDYAVLDLTARRGLEPEDLTGSATQGRGGVYTILSRASEAFAEAYVATALYFRGRDICRDLSELAGGSGAAMRVGIRRQIASHVEDCETCQATLDSLPGATDVFQALYDVDLPASLPDEVVASTAGAAAIAAGQLTFDDAEDGDEELAADEESPSDELAEAEEAETESEVVEAEAEEPAAAFDEQSEAEAASQMEEGPAEEESADVEPEDGAQQPPVSEEELWARPEAGAGLAGVAATEESLSEIEERLGVAPSEQPQEAGSVYEQYESEYESDPERHYRYVASPPTLMERISGWFTPGYGAGFLWSYALLGVSTAVAVYLGIAVAGSVSGGGNDALPAGSSDVVREIACDAGPLSVEAGGTQVFQFDPDALDGFELDRVAVTEAPSSADDDSLSAAVTGATSLRVAAAPVASTRARSDEYGLQILWLRGSEDAVTDCPVHVTVPASANASPTPAEDETPAVDETPASEETPEPTP